MRTTVRAAAIAALVLRWTCLYAAGDSGPANSAQVSHSEGRAALVGKYATPTDLKREDGSAVHYEPGSGARDVTPDQFGGHYRIASCPDVVGSNCQNGGGPIVSGMHVPSTTGVFGGSVYLDGVASDFSTQINGNVATWYMDAPDSPLINQQNPYPWCALPQPPDYNKWYVEIDGVLAPTTYRCWSSPGTLTVEWPYPWGGPSAPSSPLYYQVHYNSGHVLQFVPFNLDPVVISKVSGDGQTVAVNAKTYQQLVIQLKTASGAPVNFPIVPNATNDTTTKPSATISGPSKSTPSIASIDFIGGNQFGITAQVGNVAGTYTVTVKHIDAGSTASVTFTITAQANVPPKDNPQSEQGTGTGTQTDDSNLTKLANLLNSGSSGCQMATLPEFAGDPVNVTNGNTLRMEVDYAQTGLSPLEFTRAYNSKGSVSPVMGNYWTTTYDRFVIPAANGQPLKLRRPDGLTIRFNQVGTSLVPDASFHGTLVKNGTGWRYTNTDQTIEDYNSSGKLTTITDLRGRVQTLTYSKGLLTNIAANTGESLTLAYTSNKLTSVKDQANRVWTYAYDAYNNLTSVKYPDATYHNYYYTDPSNPWNLTGYNSAPALLTDKSAAQVLWDYNASGFTIANYFSDSQQSSGLLKRTDILFDADGVTRTVMDGDGHTSVYNTQAINGKGYVNTIAGPGFATCGNDLARTFDSAMNITSRTQAGHTTTFSSYDAKGQFAQRTVAVGTTEQKQTDYLYDSRYFNKPTQVTEPSVVSGRSKVTTYAYDAYGNVTQKTESGFQPGADPLQSPVAISRTWKYLYAGPYHQISQITGPRTDVVQNTQFTYDATTGRLKSVVDANGITRRNNITYTSTGHIASEDRPNGLHLAYAYYAGNDLLQSVTETAGTAVRKTTWSYDYEKRVTGISFSDSVNTTQTISFAYDNSGQLNWVHSDAGMIKYTFDAQGNPVRDSYQFWNQGEQAYIQRTFDAYNRVNTLVGANNTIDYDFSPDGTLTQSKDGKQQITKRLYDGLKRLSTVVRPDQSLISYGYDTGGNLSTVIDPNQATTSYVYDDFHNKVAQISPDTGTTSYAYDLAGNLTRVVDALNQATVLAYDAGNRLLTVDRVGTAYDEVYTYDNCTNGSGLLCSINNGSAESVAYKYNGFGEVSTRTTTGNKGVSYVYDAQGHVTNITYPSGRTVNYLYNGGGQITSVTVSENGNTAPILSNITYEPFGPPTGWTFGNGLTQTRSYDKQYWNRSIVTPNVSSLSYTSYDANGNLLGLTSDGAGQTFSYDTFDELQSAQGDFGSRGYTYDSVGNRTSLTADGASTSYTYAPNSNRISTQTAWSYTLDANGNITQKTATDGSGSGLRFAYSPHNRLTSVYSLQAPSAPLGTYVYNALGQRVQKTTAAGTTRYVFGLNGALLAETDGAGNVQQEYVYLNGAPIALLGVPQPSTPAAYDVSTDTSGTTTTAWTVKSATSAVGGSYYYLDMSKTPAATEAYWNFTLPYSGYYDLYVSWAGTGESFTRYTVFTTQPNYVVVNTAQSIGTWVKLGNFHFPLGTTSTVRLESTQNSVARGAYLTADAARMVLTSADSPPNPNYRYIHTDQLGEPRAITNASGTVIWRAKFDPFGLATIDADVVSGSSVTLNLRLLGQYFDAETGLHHNSFRDYDPLMGRFLESDPVGLGGGLDSYSYAHANPVTRTDRLGLADVYIWNYEGSWNSWGHASVDAGGVHMSWWPQKQGIVYSSELLNIYDAPPFPHQSLMDDENFEDRPADLVIHLNNLDEKAMVDWWESFKQTHNRWSSLTQNCSTTAYEALQAGGGDEKVPSFPGPRFFYWTPSDVASYARDIQAAGASVNTKYTDAPPLQ